MADYKKDDDFLDEDKEDQTEEESTDDELIDEDIVEEIPEDVEAPSLAGSVVNVNLENEMKNSFLSYAMSVIVQRALPDVRDGMKPVHRRILYAMNDLGVYSDKPHKKSARIVGDVIGKYHPHGDTAVYEAMVRMAQDFSYRYPLVDGHGNFGSVDGDGAAAMRYTEARMSKVAMEMLRDLNKNTVDFQDNYDGSETEPVVLPARYPNLLVNGATGIAVGMATNIPPHNMGEVIDGTLAIIRNPKITCEELMEYIPAPDFPTGGVIMGVSQVKQAYLTGMGTITIRGKVNVVQLNNGKKEIVITEIPYQVNKTKLIERIADLAKDKIIEGITDLRDESSRKGMKIIIELRRDVNVNVILNNLYKYSQLQISYGINSIALDKGQPRVLSLKQILECYVAHQEEVITRRTKFDLDKAKARLHIVEGVLIALANIDEVIKVIKASKTPDIAISELISRFILSEIQAKAILDMRLQRLTGLEIEKLQAEAEDLKKLVIYLEDILANHDKRMNLIINELSEIKKKYGDDRLTEIDIAEGLDVPDEDLIPVEDVIITITNKGYIKRMSTSTYKTQKRGGKGITGAKVQDEDFVERVIYTSSHDYMLYFSNFGKVYLLKAYEIPTGSRNSKGLPLVNLLKFDENEKLAAVINVKSIEQGGYLIFATRNGVIKKTPLIQYKNIRSTGIKAIILNKNDELMTVALTDGSKDVIVGASNWKAVRFNENEVRSTNRAASGVKGIKVAEGERAIGMVLVDNEKDDVLILSSTGFGKRTNVDAFKVKGRNGKGVKYMNQTSKNGTPVCLDIVHDNNNDVIIVTDKGMIIRTPLDQISTVGRDTQGVRILTLNENHTVASMTIVPKTEEDSFVDNDNEIDDDASIKEKLLKLDESSITDLDDEDSDELSESSDEEDEI